MICLILRILLYVICVGVYQLFKHIDAYLVSSHAKELGTFGHTFVQN